MTAQQMVFLTVSMLLFAGIWLSGWTQVHWLLYVPASLAGFAGITGICPGLIIWQKLGFK